MPIPFTLSEAPPAARSRRVAFAFAFSFSFSFAFSFSSAFADSKPTTVTLPGLRADFDRAADRPRILALVSPT